MSLGKVLKAVLVFKVMMIEWVVIRGWTEESARVDGQVNGKKKVGKRLTNNICLFFSSL